MFDAKKGEKLAREVYDDIVATEDVELWYTDSYYDVVKCWAHAADEQLQGSDKDELTDLMAWALEDCSTDDAWVAFTGGFMYLLGTAFDSEYAFGWGDE